MRDILAGNLHLRHLRPVTLIRCIDRGLRHFLAQLLDPALRLTGVSLGCSRSVSRVWLGPFGEVHEVVRAFNPVLELGLVPCFETDS